MSILLLQCVMLATASWLIFNDAKIQLKSLLPALFFHQPCDFGIAMTNYQNYVSALVFGACFRQAHGGLLGHSPQVSWYRHKTSAPRSAGLSKASLMHFLVHEMA